VTAETVRIPQPLIAGGVVSNDVSARQLSLRLSELESGYGRLLWRQAFLGFGGGGGVWWVASGCVG
jgi:hypothetical protein